MSMTDIRQRFIQADPDFGPVPFWWWSAEEVTAERVRWQLQKFRSGGLRNIGIINIAPTGPQYGSVSDNPAYFSERWWTMFEVALREAGRLGMKLFFYDQIGFSGSNFPAHIVAKHPEYTGYSLKRFPAGEPLPEGAEPLADTGEYRYAAVRQGFNWLDPQAVALLLDRVHGEFERRFPHDLGRTIGGSFQDELPPLPLWTAEMPALYRERYGEDLLPQLALLFDEQPDSAAVRRRVYDLAAELAEASLFIPLSAWHDKYGMLLCCDQAGPARRVDVHGAQRLYLDYMRTHRWYSASGCDMDGEIKPHASMAHLHGGKRVFLEAFHTSGWGGTLEETLHWLIPWFQAGVTLYSAHAVYFSTRGGWWEWAPPDTGWRQPYYEHYAVFADTISRICALLSEGTHIADIAVHYPSQAACGYMSLSDGEPGEHPMSVSNRMPNDAMNHLQDVYVKLTGRAGRKEQYRLGALREARLDFDITDDSALEKAVVEAGRLRIADERFSVLLLCGTTVMGDAARARVEAWIGQGGLVVGVEVPEAERGLAGAIYAADADEALRLIEARIPRRVEGKGETLHRRTGDADIFLLLPDRGLLPMHHPANAETAIQEQAVYRLRTAGVPEIWDPVGGSSAPARYRRDGEWVEVEVPFATWPAALVVCPYGEAAAPAAERSAPEGSAADGGRAALAEPAGAAVPARMPAALPETGGAVLPADGWRILPVPTLDNRYGDFYLHGERTEYLPLEVRNVRVKQEERDGDGERADWHAASFDDASWESRLWSEAAYWLACSGDRFEEERAWKVVYSQALGDMKFRTWAGRMGRVPRRFLNLGQAAAGETVWARTQVFAPQAGRYWIRVESNCRITGTAGGREIAWSGGPEEQTAWIELDAGSNELLLRAEAIVDGLLRAGVEVNAIERPALPKWIYSRTPNAGTRLTRTIESRFDVPLAGVRMVFAARGRVSLVVNGTHVTEHGDFNPYIRQGQEEVDVTSLWREGTNEVSFVMPEGEGEVLADAAIELFDGRTFLFCTGEDWTDEQGNGADILHEAVLQFAETETLWLTPRPHPLPRVGWLMEGSVPDPKPLDFRIDGSAGRRPIWVRFPLPIGARSLTAEYAGSSRLWIGGREVAVRGGKAEFAPQPAGTMAAMRIMPDELCSEADVLLAPIRFQCAHMTGSLGDWRSALHLPHHSGAVEYETSLTLDEPGSLMLDLGHVRGTAEVWLDGVPAGVRAWRPYRYELGSGLARGEHVLRVRVTNTLGTHYESGRPTSNAGGGEYYWSSELDPRWPDDFASGGLYGPVTVYRG